MADVVLRNPVLRGFNPDPVMFRDDRLYYIAVSTFEWLPGVRVYSSKDLADWRYETSILDERSGVDLSGDGVGCAIWAPYVGYHNGRYYAVYTDVKQTAVPYKDVRNYVVTATDIHGPWSKATYVNGSGFDPSLYFDDDGRVYFLNVLWDYRLKEHNKSAGIVMQEINPDDCSLIGKPKHIFAGTAARKTEAPQLYRHGGYYYLLTAEGGTGGEHQETVARSRDIWGPYEVDPDTPLLSAAGQPMSPLQCAGHASLVETPEDGWYMAHLCTRPRHLGEGRPTTSILGRETALERVVWTDDGWLRLESGGHTPCVDVAAPSQAMAFRPVDGGFVDSLKGHAPEAKYWNTLRSFADPSWLKPGAGGLEIFGGTSPQCAFGQHMVATRQTGFSGTVSVDMDFEPESYLQLAGLTLYLDMANYVLLMCTADDDGSPRVVLQRCVAGDFEEVCSAPVLASSLRLGIELDGGVARFSCAQRDGGARQSLGELDISFLAGGYTGNFIGLDVIDMNRCNGCSARFADFSYSTEG